MSRSTEVLPESIVVELSPGTAVLFGRAPDGLDLIPFRLVPVEDQAEIVAAVRATSPILDFGAQVADEFSQPKGLVRLNSTTLDAWRACITPPPLGDYFTKTWHAGTQMSQIRWLPAPENAPSVVLARLGLAAPMLKIQTRLDAVLKFSRDDTALADRALEAVRHDEWAELWGRAQAVTDALNQAIASDDVTPELLDGNIIDSLPSPGQMRDRLKRRVLALADEWDEQGPLPGLVRFIEAKGEEALLDLHGLLIAHKSWFEYMALRAARARRGADRNPRDLAWLNRFTKDMLEGHEEMLRVAGRAISTIDFTRDNWHLRKADEPGYAGPSMDRPEWDRMRHQLGAATRKLADA